jgi:hypothetical protein
MASTWVTIPAITVSKDELNNLPEEVLHLVAMGQYSLYRGSAKDHPNCCYLLRTGPEEFFLLESDGEPVVAASAREFDIQAEIIIEGVNINAVVPKFNRD